MVYEPEYMKTVFHSVTVWNNSVLVAF